MLALGIEYVVGDRLDIGLVEIEIVSENLGVDVGEKEDEAEIEVETDAETDANIEPLGVANG